jgi:hypothetical protein
MSFVKNNALLFTASVSNSNSTLLEGQTVLVEHQAQQASNCALDLTLWHRRLDHVNMDYIRRMAKENSALWSACQVMVTLLSPYLKVNVVLHLTNS